MLVPEAKRLGMIEDISALREASEGAERDDVEGLTGRCLHIAQVANEANPYLSPMYAMQEAKLTLPARASKPPRRIKPRTLSVIGSNPTQKEYQRALRWWQHALECGISAPLAPRLEFPSLEEEGSAFMFTDAAREAGTGHGGFSIIETAAGERKFLWADPRWDLVTLEALRANEISMPAGEGIGAVSFAAALAAALEGLRFLLIFSDSTAVVQAVQSNNSDSPQLNAVTRWLFERCPGVQFLAVHQPGVRNDAADGLSRHRTAEVLAEARAAGLSTQELACKHLTAELNALAASSQQRHNALSL